MLLATQSCSIDPVRTGYPKSLFGAKVILRSIMFITRTILHRVIDFCENYIVKADTLLTNIIFSRKATILK